MHFLTWPEWGVVRDQRDAVGEAYIAISDRLAAEGYRVRWNTENSRYDAQLIVKRLQQGLFISQYR